jgi:hypothetical protein
VIRGNHHDAWVNGACDPVSGASAELRKQGWKPERTIIYCFWDGEEPGLLGSTEWAETYALELKQQGRGTLPTDAARSPVLIVTLRPFRINENDLSVKAARISVFQSASKEKIPCKDCKARCLPIYWACRVVRFVGWRHAASLVFSLHAEFSE